MMTKNDIQKEIDNLQKQIESLTARRKALNADREKLVVSIDERKQLIGESLIASRDISQEFTILTSDEAKLDGLNGAIALADERLFELENKHKLSLMAFAKVDFEKLADEADDLLKGFLDTLSTAVKFVPALDAKFSELFEIQAKAGEDISSGDHLRFVRDIYRSFEEETKMIVIKFERYETAYPAVLSKVRQRKSR